MLILKEKKYIKVSKFIDLQIYRFIESKIYGLKNKRLKDTNRDKRPIIQKIQSFKKSNHLKDPIIQKTQSFNRSKTPKNPKIIKYQKN